MKRMLFILTGLFMAFGASAQTWDEWFRQKKTSIRYLTEQIVALRVYGSTVKKGYGLVNGGLKNIGQLKGDDLQLHRDRFASLSSVKPTVKNTQSLKRIGALQSVIRGVYNECQKKFLKESVFTTPEKDYFRKVLLNVLSQCTAANAEAILLAADGGYQMSDDERLKRLQGINESMDEHYVFIRRFRNEIAGMAIGRLKEQKEVRVLKSLH